MPVPRALLAITIASTSTLTTATVRADPEVGTPAKLAAADGDTPNLHVYDVHLAIDLPIIVLGATAGLLRPYLANHVVDERCPCSSGEINSFDRRFLGHHSDTAGLTSDVTVGLALAAPPLLDLLVLGPKRVFVDDVIVLTETVMVSTLFQQVANFGYQRPRPRTYEGDPTDLHAGEGYLSFLAGHVATTTAVLTASAFTLRQRYGEQVWPWIVTGVVAASVGTERVLGGYHFPSDVVLGAALGLGVGLAVPWLHAHEPAVHLTIASVPSGYGVVALGQF